MYNTSRNLWRTVGVMLLGLSLLQPGYAIPTITFDSTARMKSHPSSGLNSVISEILGKSNASVTTVQKTDEQVKSHTEAPQGRIAFASDRAGNFDIYTIDPNGGGLMRLTEDPADDIQPVWSPDGQKIAFVSNRDGNQEIYIMNAGGGGVTRVTNHPGSDLHPAWSPDGNTLAFVSDRDGNDEIYTVNVATLGANSVFTNITNNTADDDEPAWSPDGTQIAFSSNRDGDKFEIYRAAANGTNVVRLTNNSFNDVKPSWSPMKISFQSDRDGNDEIYTMNASDGGDQVRITNNDAPDIDPFRSSDGGRIVWASLVDNNNLELFTANSDGSNPLRLTNDSASDINPAIQPLPVPNGSIQFGAATFAVGEGAGSAVVTVTRTGSTTGTAIIDFSTTSGTASARTDFTPRFGTLTFAAGETSKTISIPLIDDALVEGDETFSVTLGGATGAALGSPSTATVTITDNDAAPSAANPLDNNDFFVRQQYLDFLNREPDAPGQAFWSGTLGTQIAACDAQPTPNAKQNCIVQARARVSVAFFLSTEFQQTGFAVIGAYQEAFGRPPTFQEFLQDVQSITEGVNIAQPGGFDRLAASKRAFLDNFVNRDAFKNRYAATSNTDYVNALFNNAGVDPNTEAATRDALVSGLNNGSETRATALAKVGNTRGVYNSLFNRGIVLMQYFGYLRRDPDIDGFNFWLTKLNAFSLPDEDTRDANVALARINRAQMVESFIISTEYRTRFGTS